MDAKAVVRPHTAREALGKLLAVHAHVPGGRILGLREGDRRRRLELRGARLRLCDNGLAVEQEHPPVLGRDCERPIQRRRQPKRHLGRPVHERRQPSRCVAAVRGLRRTAVTPVDSDVFA
jgi:hypothetical protein